MSNISFEDLMECYNKLNVSNYSFLDNEISINDFSRYKIIEDINMVDIKTDLIHRSWKERLFSIPWKPWIKIKVVKRNIPKQEFYFMNNLMGEKVIVCHPFMVERLKRLAKLSIKNSRFDNEMFERYLGYYNSIEN